MPGSIHNPLARGCHALIRDGAKLVEGATDVLLELAPLLAGRLGADPQGPSPLGAGAGPAAEVDGDYEKLVAALGHDPAAPDELIRRTGLPADAVASMLLLLELQGRVSSYPGGRYGRRAGPGDGAV